MDTPIARSSVWPPFSFILASRSMASGLRTTLSVMLVTASFTRGASSALPACSVSNMSFTTTSFLLWTARDRELLVNAGCLPVDELLLDAGKDALDIGTGLERAGLELPAIGQVRALLQVDDDFLAELPDRFELLVVVEDESLEHERRVRPRAVELGDVHPELELLDRHLFFLHGHRSELEDMVVLQRARPQVAGQLVYFLHRELDLAGLEMRDIDLRRALELRQLLGEHGRAQVQRELGEPAVLVGKRGLDDEELQVLDPVDRLPQSVIGAGIAGEHQARLAAVEVVAGRRNRVAGV